MGSQNKVVVEYTRHLDVRYLHTRTSVTLPTRKPNPIELGVTEVWDTTEIGEKGVRFIQLLEAHCREKGLVRINLSEYQITLIKATAFEWPSIMEAVFSIFSQVYLEGRKPDIHWIKRGRLLVAYLKNI